MAAEALAMHFSEVHPDEVEVPKCNLCLQVRFWISLQQFGSFLSL